MKYPVHIGRCRCGKERGHEGPCLGENTHIVQTPHPNFVAYTPWHGLRDRLIEQYGPELGLFLAKRIGTSMRKKDCIDQFSVVEIPSRWWHRFMPRFSIEWGRHIERRSGGCCGSFDDTIVHYRTGRIFTWGFNYGH